MLNKIKQTLGLTNRELTEKGIDKSQLTRWKKNGFHNSTEILFNLFVIEMNAMKKNDFIKKYIAKCNDKPDQKKLTSEILGMQKWHEFTGLIIPEWLGLELVDEIMKKMGHNGKIKSGS